MRMKELAAARVRYGYRRIHILLLREGWWINAKRVYRLYCEENLSLRTRTPKRRVSCRTRVHRSEQSSKTMSGAGTLCSIAQLAGLPSPGAGGDPARFVR